MQERKIQERLSAAELQVVLGIYRAGSLSGAGARMGLDDSTVSRTLKRIEKSLRQPLFERSRSGVTPTELAHKLASHAERIEAELDAAHAATVGSGEEPSGQIHITTTDAIAAGLLWPALGPLCRQHPKLGFAVSTGNALLSLSKRDADLALRATPQAPENLVGKDIGAIHTALFAAPGYPLPAKPDDWHWVTVDEALPEHPSVRWRKQAHPGVVPHLLVDGLVAATQAVVAGLGVGVLPLFLASQHPELIRLQAVPKHYATHLWLLMHPEARHLRHISAAYQFLAQHLHLPQPDA